MSVPYEMLLHPELLTNEKLIQIIHERYLRVQNLEKMSRPELLELFHQFCVPFGQRMYRDAGRGKILNEVRQTNSASTTALNLCNSKTLNNNRLSCLEKNKTLNNNINNRKSRLKEDHLKPSYDALLGHIKRITLDKKPQPPIVNNYKRKSSTDYLTLPPGCPAAKKERKPITWP